MSTAGSWIMRILITMVVGISALIAVAWFVPEWSVSWIQTVERARAGVESHQTQVDGRTLHYLRGGEGPALILIHGFGADSYNWIRIAPFLADQYNLIIPDLTGFGASPGGASLDYSIEAQSQRVLAFMDALGIDSAHLGGSSMGGYIAATMATIAPDRVHSLWLLAPGGVMSSDPSEMFLAIQENEKANPLIPATREQFDRTLDFVFEQPPFIPAPLKAYFAEQMVANQAVAEKVFADIRYRSKPLEETIDAGFSTPALIIWGAQDRVLHSSGARILENLMANGVARVVPGLGHLPMLEAPERMAEIYLDWQESGTGSESSNASSP